MKKIYLIAIIIFAGITFFIFTRERNQLNDKSAQAPQLSAMPSSVLETQINSEGPVSIKITPKLSSEIIFEVALDTHSEELNTDLIQAVILRDENDKEYKPLRWEGDLPGGHHRGGLLIFSSIIPTPKIFRLIIQDIGNIAEREFLWVTRS